MNRRRFLAVLGAAAAGAGGISARLGSRDEAPEETPLPDAVSTDGDRLGARSLVWSGETAGDRIALTFDDGPDPRLTPDILDVLDRFSVPAMFCVMGYSAVRHPELLGEIVNRGHEIGIHTWDHRDFATLSPAQTKEQLVLARDIVGSLTGVEARYFRPPYGRLTGTAVRQAAEMGYDVVLWSLGRGELGVRSPADVADHLAGQARAGDIVLLHDGVGRELFDPDVDGRGPVRMRREVELRALPEAVERMLEKGLRITSLSDLLGTSEVEGREA